MLNLSQTSPRCRDQSPHPPLPFPATAHIHLLLGRSTYPHPLAKQHLERSLPFSPEIMKENALILIIKLCKQ